MNNDNDVLKEIETEVVATLKKQLSKEDGVSKLAFQISTLSVMATRLFFEKYEKHLIEKIKNEIK